MKWRVMVELIGSDGIAHAHEVNAGGSNTAECSAETVGLTLADGKRTLAGLQDHLVQAQTQEYCRQRRLCSHCGSQRPLKGVRADLVPTQVADCVESYVIESNVIAATIPRSFESGESPQHIDSGMGECRP